MENAVLNTMLSRSSIRAYSEKKLTAEELDSLKKAALSAPTAMNRRDQRFIFVTNEDKIAEFEAAVMNGIIASGNTDFAERMKARGGKVAYGSPLIVFICAKPSHYAPVDAGIAVENIALAAKSLGLDSVILGMPSVAFSGEGSEAIRSSFGFPEGYEFQIAIAVGHRAMDKEPHEWDEAHVIELM
ncbi:MAG: nitroreductase family protein [Clostridia bacterium]|nr:nitroreductase family protein [Clostridia bacterium]